MHVITIIIIVKIVSLIVTWNNFVIILVINGVASVNVVAVPASKANTANKSINLPKENHQYAYQVVDDKLPRTSDDLPYVHVTWNQTQQLRQDRNSMV